jgi:hypothetical protein
MALVGPIIVWEAMGGSVSLDMTYDDSDGKIRTVHYYNETPWACYLRVFSPGEPIFEMVLAANNEQTATIPPNARPLYDVQFEMGFVERASITGR